MHRSIHWSNKTRFKRQENNASMANKKNSTRVCDITIAQVFLLAIASRIEQDIHPQRGWSHTNRYYKTVNSEYILLIPQLVDDKNHGFCAKHHALLLNLVLDTYRNCTICCIPEFKRWHMQSVIAFLSLSWKTLVWRVLPPLAPSSSMMIVNGDGQTSPCFDILLKNSAICN